MPPSTPASIRPEDAETARNEHESIGRGERPGSVYHADRNSMATTGRHAGAGGGTMAEQEHTHVSTSQRMISATWGSVLTSLLVTPLDVVRVRLQSQSPIARLPVITPPSVLFKELPPNLGVTSCCREVFWVGNNGQFCMVGNQVPDIGKPSGGAMAADCAVEETQRKTFTSTLDGLRKIARNEGPLTLWRGLSPTLLMAIPANVIYFTGYDWLRYDKRSPIARYVDEHSAAFVAGAAARIAAAAAISPIEMFRTRLQATSGTGTDHFRATFKGSTSSDAESNAVVFVESFTGGAISGAVSALITTPFDVGKTRQQVFRHDALFNSSPSPSPGPTTSGSFTSSSFAKPNSSTSVSSAVLPEQLSIPRFLLHIFREEGVGGLFKGWAARCMKVAPACAIMISSYELGKQMAGHVNERRYHLAEHDHHADHKPQGDEV
uniref:Solute carrier family 25 member 39 n=1 Tax=Coccidioides posadasii RMSCC 3488 TaxID=454284 RepID=A0A0J6F847_COCPO|nr:solute carrier family 25 member 39 [Coccidioides posadasii RMSCC 3488]